MTDAYFDNQPSAEDIETQIAGFGGWYEIDLDALSANLRAIQSRTSAVVMPVIKNNAYGHGLQPIAAALAADGIDWFLVAKTREALALRDWFPACNVVNMDPLYTDAQCRAVVEAGATQVVYSSALAHQLNAAAVSLGKTAGVFIKVDTGLHRVGIDHAIAIDLIKEIDALPGLKIQGTYSTQMQDPDNDGLILERYNALLGKMAEAGIDPGFRSLASTNGIFHDPNSWFDMVRPAMCLFGLYPWVPDRETDLALRQVLTFKARIEEVKTVKAGDSVTYFGAYAAEKDVKVGTLHVGFYDGLPRELANKGTIMVGDTACPSIGSVSLNHYLFDASGTDAAIGDVVELIGVDGPNDLVSTAKTAGWMVYSLLNHLGRHVPRVYRRGGKAVALLEPPA